MKRIFNWFMSLVLVVLVGLTCQALWFDPDLVVNIAYMKEIKDNEGYQSYKDIEEKHLLDDDGFYKEPSITKSSDNPGATIVTFAKNNFINARYFTDRSHKDEITEGFYYALPGSSIYAEVEVNNKQRDNYEFSGFELFEFKDQERVNNDTLKADYSSNGEVLHIPEDYQGTDISIMPMGHYVNKTIKLNDYFLDDQENEHNMDGEWQVNDALVLDDHFEINPFASYIVSYRYDPKLYFFVNSTPAAFYFNELDGQIIFSQKSNFDQAEDYEVKLHQYMSRSIVSDKDRVVSLDDERKNLRANETWTIDNLKYGQTITVQTDKKWENLENSQEFVLTGEKQLADSTYKYQYTLRVPEQDGAFLLKPSDYTYEHGKVTFKCYGSVVTNEMYVNKGSRIYYEQADADEGYRLEPGNIVVGEQAETQKELQSIQFIKAETKTLNLDQPSSGGRITYYINGQKTISRQIEVAIGKSIKMDFEAWEGWKGNYTNGREYIVSERDSCVMIDGIPVAESAFEEDPDHMPPLTVTLNDSLGSDIRFKVISSGEQLNEKENGDWKPWNLGNMDIVKDKPIHTDTDLIVSLSNNAIPSNKVIVLEVTKTPRDGKDKNSTIVIQRLPQDISIPVYESLHEMSKTWYESINIKISMADAQKHIVPHASSHTRLSVVNNETGKELSAGELMYGMQKVTVNIEADNDYYLNGKKVNGSFYRETMSYSDYVKNIDNIIESHSAAKFIHVTLDESDSFAKYKYYISKDQVSGTVSVKEDDEIKLIYTVTDSKHKIDTILNLNEVTKTIKIKRSMDGKTIGRSDFGINVKE